MDKRPINSNPFMLKRSTWKDIIDLDDLADYIEVMRGTVDALKTPSDSSELLCVSVMQLMTEYVLIEDSLWTGLLTLMKLACTELEQSTLLELTENFSILSADFQETWDDTYWGSYDLIRAAADTKNIEKQRAELLYVITQEETPDFQSEMSIHESIDSHLLLDNKDFDRCDACVGTSGIWPEPLLEGNKCDICRLL